MPNSSRSVPLKTRSTAAPLAPLVWSQAWKVIPSVTVPFQSASGTKRTKVPASAPSSRAASTLGDPNAVQTVPPSVENSQVPLVSSTPTTAMPATAPGSASVTQPEIRSDTSVPPLVNASSLIPARSSAPEITGAAFTSFTTMTFTTGSLTPESPSVSVNFAALWLVDGSLETFS